MSMIAAHSRSRNVAQMLDVAMVCCLSLAAVAQRTVDVNLNGKAPFTAGATPAPSSPFVMPQYRLRSDTDAHEGRRTLRARFVLIV